ncbi:MAG: hypothetical protein PHT59_04500 [Candidatus Omnitrophica bacterium]|nr:hypothetical protein [Candidatus Omnitrophota bacterium]
MVLVKKDAEGRIIAFAEIRMVDAAGADDKRGEYVWVNNVWVHEDYRQRGTFNRILKGFINKGAQDYPWAKYIYWQRDAHNNICLYDREKILRRTHEQGREGRTSDNANTHTVPGACAVGCSV